MSNILKHIQVGDMVYLNDSNLNTPHAFTAEDEEFINNYCLLQYEVLSIIPLYQFPMFTTESPLLTEKDFSVVLRRHVIVSSLPEDDDEEYCVVEEEFEERADNLFGDVFITNMSKITAIVGEDEGGDDDDDD